MTKWGLVFSKGLHDRLIEFLFKTQPYENGCYLTSDYYASKKTSYIIIKNIVLPTDGSWDDQNTENLSPSSEYLNSAVVEAHETGTGLIFIHTHPHKTHPAKFSVIDEITNKQFFF